MPGQASSLAPPQSHHNSYVPSRTGLAKIRSTSKNTRDPQISTRSDKPSNMPGNNSKQRGIYGCRTHQSKIWHAKHEDENQRRRVHSDGVSIRGFYNPSTSDEI
ncbi:hypothetical protein ABZP36_006647 [Zizania latifolia]